LCHGVRTEWDIRLVASAGWELVANALVADALDCRIEPYRESGRRLRRRWPGVSAPGSALGRPARGARRAATGADRSRWLMRLAAPILHVAAFLASIVQLATTASRPPYGRRFAMASPAWIWRPEQGVRRACEEDRGRVDSACSSIPKVWTVMAGVPFVCPRCGLHWGNDDRGPQAVRVNDNAKSVTLADIRMTCPRCGTITRSALPDGTYKVDDGQWRLVRRLADDLKSAQANRDDYAQLFRLLREAQGKGETTEEVAANIAAQTPFARLAQTIRAHPPGWTAWILAAVLAIVLWITAPPGESAPASGNPPPSTHSLVHLSPHQLDELAREIAQQLHAENLKAANDLPAVRPSKGSERNKPCPCGSGIKNTKCCGAPA
jgi:hypothetical protein